MIGKLIGNTPTNTGLWTRKHFSEYDWWRGWKNVREEVAQSELSLLIE